MPACRRVQVTAPCRLHFGLLAFGRSAGRQFGGVGVMVDHPAIVLQVTAADRLQAIGPAAARAVQFAREWARFSNMAEQPGCLLDVQHAAEQHSGLGVGTQLGLSVAAALNAWYGLPQATPAQLAISVGRGQRSAVGSYGFAQGGLIVERGKLPGEPIAPLDCRLDLPDGWRFVLIQRRSARGLFGAAEQQAFGRLAPVPRETTQQLSDELRNRMVPAAALADFAQFSASVYEYGRLAGTCFGEIQGGPYNGPDLTRLVQEIRSLGIVGVGQSSWGPTVFALLETEAEAQELVRQLSERSVAQTAQLSIAAVDNQGARVQVDPT
jgi:beta-RFAP synthase